MMQELEFALLHEAKYVALYLLLLWMVVLVVLAIHNARHQGGER